MQSITFRFIIFRSTMLLSLLVLLGVPARADFQIDVAAGKHDRNGTPVIVPLPKGVAKDGVHAMIADDEKWQGGGYVQTIAGQQSLFFLANVEAGKTRRYTVREPTKPPLLKKGYLEASKGKKDITIIAGSTPALQYHHAPVDPPVEGKDLYTRSAFIHPVKTPAGVVVTNAFPAKHLHHYGIWFPWRDTTYDGQSVNFWEVGGGEGTVRTAGVEEVGDNYGIAWFRVKHEHVAKKVKGGPVVVLNETWDVRVYANSRGHLFDITSTQTCATDKPLTIDKKYYGGMGLRGADEWEDPKKVEFLTSEGKTRADGNFTAARWVEMHGKVGGKPVGIAVLSHPSNFRAPQKTRIHPKEPFLNFVPAQDEPFTIEPGKPYVSRYRYYVHDGEVNAKECERLWRDYAEPPVVKVVK